MWDHMSGYGGGWMGLGLLFMILLWALVILAIVALWRHLGGRGNGRQALDVLEQRYARGEIDREEYLQKRKDLERPAR